MYLNFFDFAAYISCSNQAENSDKRKRFLSSAKLMLVSVVSQIEVSVLKIFFRYILVVIFNVLFFIERKTPNGKCRCKRRI